MTDSILADPITYLSQLPLFDPPSLLLVQQLLDLYTSYQPVSSAPMSPASEPPDSAALESLESSCPARLQSLAVARPDPTFVGQPSLRKSLSDKIFLRRSSTARL
ncbi:hypothetical protein [Phaffia rhodozyma]|uniref:Uncharacterized protein n=1 Tax=Phaffia rhodozyma TaxID=264483 RepID=A0A0F7SHQ8_PHARH|nr:hypothetical protein [Phaffia rhodozyma]